MMVAVMLGESINSGTLQQNITQAVTALSGVIQLLFMLKQDSFNTCRLEGYYSIGNIFVSFDLSNGSVGSLQCQCYFSKGY